MPYFRKKPVLVEAVQFLGTEQSGEEIEKWSNGAVICFCVNKPDNYMLRVKTLEGTMFANPIDWIIKGVNGEFYPCRYDIFQKTYESA